MTESLRFTASHGPAMKDKEEKSTLYFCLDALELWGLFLANTLSSYSEVRSFCHLALFKVRSLCSKSYINVRSFRHPAFKSDHFCQLKVRSFCHLALKSDRFVLNLTLTSDLSAILHSNQIIFVSLKSDLFVILNRS